MVHFPGFASRPLLYSGADIPKLLGIPLKDSEIPRSQPVCGSLRLIAAYHVLHRLPSPRHPPHALSSLTIKFTPLEIPKRNFIRTQIQWSTLLPVVTRLSKIAESGLCRKPKAPISKPLVSGAAGGGKRVRTADPLLAKQVLFQLSYTPPKTTGGPR